MNSLFASVYCGRISGISQYIVNLEDVAQAAPLDLQPRDKPSAVADKMLPAVPDGGDARFLWSGPCVSSARGHACRAQPFREPKPLRCGDEPRERRGVLAASAPHQLAAPGEPLRPQAGRRYLPPAARVPPPASARPRGGARGSDFSRQRSGAAERRSGAWQRRRGPCWRRGGRPGGGAGPYPPPGPLPTALWPRSRGGSRRPT